MILGMVCLGWMMLLDGSFGDLFGGFIFFWVGVLDALSKKILMEI